MAATYDLHITQGQDFSEAYTWTSENGRESFDDWTPTAQIRAYPGSGVLRMDLTPHLTIEDGVVDANEVTGQAIRLYLTGEQTAGLRYGGSWDLFLVNGTTRVALFTGKAIVTRTVTTGA